MLLASCGLYSVTTVVDWRTNGMIKVTMVQFGLHIQTTIVWFLILYIYWWSNDRIKSHIERKRTDDI